MSDTVKMQFNIQGLSLFIGMPVSRDIDPRTVCAMLETQAELMKRGVPISFGVRMGNSRVDRARTNVAWDFLASDCNRILWLDSDQLFTAKDVIRLLCFSLHKDIVGAVYPCKKDPIELRLSTSQKMIPAGEWGLIKVDGMGMGFVMMTKGVMRNVADHSPLVKFDEIDERMPMIFSSRLNDKMEDVGEDIGFFHDCRQLGYDVWVDPAMKIGHIGTKVYEGTLAEMSTAKDVEITPLKETA